MAGELDAPALRAAGYQGAGSILSAALQHFAAGCEPAFGAARCRVELDVTAAGGTARQLFDGVEAGTRDVAYLASGYLSARVPELAVLDLPFSVADRHTALAALDGEAGALLQAAVARRTGLRVLGFWDNGFRHVSNWRHPIRNPADCQGLVVRTLDSALYRDSLAALGFTPVTTDVKELRRVVASHEVDAQENPLTNLVNFELWRHHPHVSLTGHFFGVLLLVCRATWLDALPAALQRAVRSAAFEATAHQRQLAASEDGRALQRLQAEGVQIVAPQGLALAQMRACCAAVSERASAALPCELLAAYRQA